MKEPDTDVLVEAGTMVEIDAEHIAHIIVTLCATTDERAAKAANLIVDYLIAVHSAGTKRQ
jgi:hypothetical protein